MSCRSELLPRGEELGSLQGTALEARPHCELLLFSRHLGLPSCAPGDLCSFPVGRPEKAGKRQLPVDLRVVQQDYIPLWQVQAAMQKRAEGSSLSDNSNRSLSGSFEWMDGWIDSDR